MADNFGQLQNGRASNGGRFYAVPSVPVAANQIFMPSPATTPLFGVAEYAVAANALGSFASEGVFIFDKPADWIDDVGKKVYYRPTASNSGAFVFQEQKGDVFVGFQVLANVPANKLGVLLTTPEFVVNILLVTSTADSGSGSLREALAQIRNDETITFDDSLEDANGVITIELAADSAALNLPAYTFTIEGGSHTGSGETLKTRVVIDAAASSSNLRRVASCANSSKPTINNVTFKNGYQYSSNYGGGLFVSYNGVVVLNYCVFDTCHATDAGAIAFLNTAKGTINNCYFYNCDAVIGGVSEIRNTSAVVFNNCVFDRCFASLNGNVIYTTGTPSATINNCVFISVSNNTISTIYNGGTNANGSLIIKGFNSVDIATFAASSTVVFDGVDSILAITTTASIGAATFTAAENSTGYAAFPENTDISAATFTGVKNCTYGAGLETFAIDFEGATWTAEDLTVPILIEEKSGGTWTTLDAAATGGTYAATFAYGDSVRGFDGVQFLEASLDAYWKVKSWGVPSNGGGSDGDSDPSWVVDSSTITPNIEEL